MFFLYKMSDEVQGAKGCESLLYVLATRICE